MYPKVEFLQGDALTVLRTLPGESVHCCATSPPYWGLRDYGVDGQLGLEKNPEEYVAKLVKVFREVRRVLRNDGTCWINLGDSYWGGGNYRGINSTNTLSANQASNRGATGVCQELGAVGKTTGWELKPKDLCGIPWRLAFALQADGWWLRQDIIWSKPNPMPESVTDRCTKSHEYIFLLTKSARYFYDAEAVKEPLAGKPHIPGNRFHPDKISGPNDRNGSSQWETSMEKVWGASGARNKRSVWTVTTQPYSEAHFATFPPDLIKPCIRAGTSARGCCPKCGAPWERVVESSKTFESGSGRSGNPINGKQNLSASDTNTTPDIRLGPVVTTKTKCWDPGCQCLEIPVPCTVLDPFAGSGTTGMVALELGRKAILIELNPKYMELARKRCSVTPAMALT